MSIAIEHLRKQWPDENKPREVLADSSQMWWAHLTRLGSARPEVMAMLSTVTGNVARTLRC